MLFWGSHPFPILQLHVLVMRICQYLFHLQSVFSLPLVQLTVQQQITKSKVLVYNLFIIIIIILSLFLLFHGSQISRAQENSVLPVNYSLLEIIEHGQCQWIKEMILI